jgi:hypothetical protein
MRRGQPHPRRGQPLKKGRSLAVRFWEKVNKDRIGTGCWEWTGSLHYGYGQIWTNGKPINAHRVVLEMEGQVIPPGMAVDHLCRNLCCVNPAHLRIVTPRVNSLENNSNPWAINAAKKKCGHGHPYVPGSYYPSRGGRQCKECTRMYYLTDKAARQLGLEPRPEWIAAKEQRKAA